MRSFQRAVLLAAVAVGLGACAVVVPGQPEPAARPAIGSFCDGAQLAFEGETTLAEAGLTDFVGPDDARRRGYLQITAEKLMPPAPPGVVQDAEPTRFVCMTWADGSGLSGSIPDDYVVPEGLVGGEPAGTDAGSAEVPVLPIALAALVVAALGVAVIAFRGEESS